MILQLSELKREFKFDGYHWMMVLLVMLHSSILEAVTDGFLTEGTQCACVGDRLIYNCSVVGGVATLWRGTAFDCPLDDSEIILRHSQFESNQEIGTCNNGDIVGHGIGVICNDCYTSQLNVTVRENFDNQTVQCASTSSEGTRTIGESVLRVASATNLYLPPVNLYLTDVQLERLVFNWTPAISNCSTLQYIIASDCGACPTVTNVTTATCSDLQVSTNAVMCHFRVSSQACGFVGSPTSPAIITLKVPNVPQVEIVPSYSRDSQALERLFIVRTVNQTEDQFYISGNISGSPTSYNVKLYGSNSSSGTSFNSTVSMASCEEDSGCPIDLHSSYCPQSTAINVTISAANKLGEGPRSSPFIIECTNNFVQVVYREITSSVSTISCEFQNRSDTSEKTCCVTYMPCNIKEPRNTQCVRDFLYNIQLEVVDQSYDCYTVTVTASNDTYTVNVEGAFTLGDNHRGSSNTAAITAGVVVPAILMLLLLGTVMLLSYLRVAKRVKNKATFESQPVHIETTPLPDILSQNSLKQYLIPYSVPTTSKLCFVDGDCDIRDFVTETLEHVSEFKRGCAYYEFTNEVENILEGKKVLLQDKQNTNKWFQLASPEKITGGKLKLYGEGIARSSFGDQYRVFIQSFGSGARCLPCGSWILYFKVDNQVEPDVLPLVPVCSEYFARKVINSAEECTVEEFCSQNNLNSKGLNMFVDAEHLPERMSMRDQPPHDAILMNRESGKLFTGPYARQMLEPMNGGESQCENEKWKVFALLEKNKQGLVLKNGSEVLYQDSMYKTGNYKVLEVDQDCVRLSKFIEAKLKCQYEDGKAFYEVTEDDIDEDLLYCKKILRLQTNELNRKEVKLDSLIEYFYAIPGVPSKAVKPEQLNSGLRHYKIFIQSTSQGSRCLKRETNILYLKEYMKWTSDLSGGDSESTS